MNIYANISLKLLQFMKFYMFTAWVTQVIQDTYYCWNEKTVSKMVILVLTNHFLSNSLKKSAAANKTTTNT